MRIKDIVIMGMLSALFLTVQVGLAFLPNIELISLFVILCTLILGFKTLIIIYVFVTSEVFIYGFSTWVLNYLYIWSILFLVVYFFRRERSPYFWAIISGLYGLSFGALCSIPYFFIGGFQTMLAYWVSGIMFDLVHGVANFVLALVLFRPLYYLLEKIYQRWETVW